jgi:beta-glucosidase
MFSALQSGAHITFDVNVKQAPSANVLLSMNCEGFGDKPGSCQESIDITKLLNNAASNQWQTLSIDLQCFAKQGINFGQMVSPFELSTTGSLSLGIANIIMAAPEPNQLNVSCE